MKAFYANVFNEIQKLISKKKTVVLLSIDVIIPMAAALVVSTLQNSIGINPLNANQFTVFILGIFTNYILPLLIASVAVDTFSCEFGDKTLKIILLRPISRFKVFTSKIICIGAYIIVNLFIVFIVSSILGFIIKGNERFLYNFSSGLFEYFVSVVPMFCIAIAAGFIAQFFKSSSGALVISIIIYIALSATSIFFPSIIKIFLTSYTDWYLLWLGSSNLGREICNDFIIILSYCMIFFAGGFYLFDKKEI